MRISEWKEIAEAPFDDDLELAVIEDEEIHRLAARCRRGPSGWIDAATGQRIEVHPTHWRRWLS